MPFSFYIVVSLSNSLIIILKLEIEEGQLKYSPKQLLYTSQQTSSLHVHCTKIVQKTHVSFYVAKCNLGEVKLE